MSLINQMLSDLDTRQSAQAPSDIPLPGLHKTHSKAKPRSSTHLIVAGSAIFIVTFILIYFWMGTGTTAQKTTAIKPEPQIELPVLEQSVSAVKPVNTIQAVTHVEPVNAIEPVKAPEPRVKMVIAPMIKTIKAKKITAVINKPVITPSTLITDASNYVNKGDYNQAISTLSHYLEDNTNQHDVRATLVSIHTQRGDYPKAQSILIKAIKKWPQQHNYEMMLARLLLEQQQDQDALRILQASTNNSADYHGFIAAIYQRLSQHRMAIRHYNMALKLIPDNGLWWLGLGISQEQQGQSQKALVAFNQARNADNINQRILQYLDQRIVALQTIYQGLQ